MNPAWDLDNLKIKVKNLIYNFEINYETNFIILKINKIILDENIILPEPQLEKDIEEGINVSWFWQRKHRALWFTVIGIGISRKISMNYLADNKAIEIIDPKNKQILETIKNFLSD